MVLEGQVKTLTVTLEERLASVILVEERRPGKVPKVKKHRIIKNAALSDKMKARWAKIKAEKAVHA